MGKKIFVLIFFCLIFVATSTYGKGNNDNFEKIYKDAGYTSIEEAINSFEKNNKSTINNIPKQTDIPFKVTHTFGQFDKTKSKDVRIEYVNKDSGELFFILVYPSKNHIPITKPDKIGKFKDNKQYKIVKEKDFLTLQFQSKEFSYIMSSNTKNIKEEDFIKIANSIKK